MCQLFGETIVSLLQPCSSVILNAGRGSHVSTLAIHTIYEVDFTFEWWLMLQRCLASCHASRSLVFIQNRRVERWISLLDLNRHLSQSHRLTQDVTPLRKQLKDAVKASRGKGRADELKAKQARDARLTEWELTIGIEIHAQLNTSKKLFSRTLLHRPPFFANRSRSKC